MDREKFQQKALKQTKQKKSKSAEFLMGKEDKDIAEGVGNPAFHMSSPDLSVYQTSVKKAMRHDVPDHTLATHQRKLRLLTAVEPKGNEYSRNYFDPLMDEEINPRQCGMEVSREVKQLDKSGQGQPQDGSIQEESLAYEVPTGSIKHQELRRRVEETIPSHTEEFERYAQKDIIQLSSASLEQDLKLEGEELNEYIPMSSLKTDTTFETVQSHPLKADLNVPEEDMGARLGNLTEATHESKGTAGPRWEIEQPQSRQSLQMQIKCLRGIKDKLPEGSYHLKVSLLSGMGGLDWQECTAESLKTRTHPVRHGGHFYDVGLYFSENLHMKLLPNKEVKPGMAFLFELVLLHGIYAGLNQVVGWAAFPLCDNNLDVVEGKFKCPLLRGHYDQKLGNFKTIEDLICLDLDHWLCNLYFQVIKVPLLLDDPKRHERHAQLFPEFPICFLTEAEKAEVDMENTAHLSEKETGFFQRKRNASATMDNRGRSFVHFLQGNIANKIGPCSMDCDPSLLKEGHELHYKGDDLTDHSLEEKSTSGRTGEIEDYSQEISYLEELETHRYSVCCSSAAAAKRGSGKLSKHLHFVLASLFSELQLAQWRSQGFWYIILLMASLWFLRLYLHYLGQWLFLEAISTPVTKFHFYPYTVELCYPTSSLQVKEELPVVVAGPLTLNAVMLLLALLRWGCQLLFTSCPDVLSKLDIAMGLWTVLDPLAVFIVDMILGRFTHDGETPVADAAKLYWAFVRAMQPGILGVMITVLVYILLFIISSLILYLYCLRLHNDSWILDKFQRIHSEESKFFIPYDLEISNQELSYIVKRSEQWRGINGERKKVAVYDYIWKRHGIKSSVDSSDLQHQNEMPACVLSPGDVTSHISIYTTHPRGFQQLYRHFLRLPGGAIVEVLGDISDVKFVHNDVITAIQKHMSEMDTVLGNSYDIYSRQMEKKTLN